MVEGSWRPEAPQAALAQQVATIIAWLCSTRLGMMSSRRFWTDLFGLAAALPPLRRFRSHRHRLRCARADLVSFAELRVSNSCVLALVASAGYRQVFAYLANKALDHFAKAFIIWDNDPEAGHGVSFGN